MRGGPESPALELPAGQERAWASLFPSLGLPFPLWIGGKSETLIYLHSLDTTRNCGQISIRVGRKEGD